MDRFACLCLCSSYVFVVVFAKKRQNMFLYLGGLAPLDVLLAEAKVSDLDVAVLVQQQVLQLWKIMMNVMT